MLKLSDGYLSKFKILNYETTPAYTDLSFEFENNTYQVRIPLTSKFNIYKKAVIPSNINNIINCFKINISMSLIGVIMGELLVSKEGLGYLIMYGSQVFNINLVITSVVILGIISYLMYKAVNYLEIKVKNK